MSTEDEPWVRGFATALVEMHRSLLHGSDGAGVRRTAGYSVIRVRALEEKTMGTKDEPWVRGFATALAEMHRSLLHGSDGAGVQRTAKAAGVTLARCRKAGVARYDYDELRRAGVK